MTIDLKELEQMIVVIPNVTFDDFNIGCSEDYKRFMVETDDTVATAWCHAHYWKFRNEFPDEFPDCE